MAGNGKAYILPQRGLVSQNDQSLIERPDVPRSKFVTQWTRKMAFNAADLVPMMVDEVLPGDHLRYDVTALVRMATPLFPLFDNQVIDTFFFFVPARLVWTNWVRMMGQQDSPASSIAYTVPVVVSGTGGFAQNSIYDYFGLPTAGQTDPGATLSVNALPFRAYNLIWQEWFRDENLQTGAVPPTGDGPDAANFYGLLQRGKAHDYFTSCLPWPQKFTAPTIPLTGAAPVRGIGVVSGAGLTAGPFSVYEYDTAKSYSFAIAGSNPNNVLINFAAGGSAGSGNRPQVYADLAAAAGIQLNALRQAWLIQQLLERDARGGTRYTELLTNHFGVRSPDARLQRPEYIGGGRSQLTLTPVAQTTPVASNGVVGSLGAAGSAVGRHHAEYAAVEHGYIIGLINVRSDLSYQQGLHKMWSRSTRYDFYWPSFANLGEQAVLTQEIYSTGLAAGDQTVFGYQERWAEYRQRYSEVVGVMRSTASGTLDMWHLAQKFVGAPVLNSTFITDAPPMARVLAAGAGANNQQYLSDIMFHRQAVRPLPMFSTPAKIGRF